MNLTLLIDNTSSVDGIEGAHGFCAAIYLDDGSLWLWDAGPSDLAVRNARALGVDVSQACGMALSHGHYDHTGGISAIIQAGFDGYVFAHPASTEPRWSVRTSRPVRPIGWKNPQPAKDRLRPVRGVQTLAADADGAPLLTMVTDIPRLPGNAEHIEGFFHDPQGDQPDHVQDDACLVAHTRRGRVLVLGCCHSGLANTLAAADDATSEGGASGFACVFGGLHLMDVEDEQDERIGQTLEALGRHGVRSLRPGHCTGALAGSALARGFPGKFQPLRVGLTVRF